MTIMAAQWNINATFSQQQQEQPIGDCGEVMAVHEISSSRPEDASINSRKFYNT